MVCTDRYVEKANAGTGGVGYEKMIVTADLLKNINSNKIIPIIRQSGTHNVPVFLRSKLFIDLSLPDSLEFGFDELIRTIHGAPLFAKPLVGNNPFKPVEASQQQRTGDPLKELMKFIVDDFEAGGRFSVYDDLRARLPISRVMFDILLAKAEDEDLVRRTSTLIYLKDAGKVYAVEHKLVDN